MNRRDGISLVGVIAALCALAVMASAAEPARIVVFGDSTTAPRANTVVYGEIIQTELNKAGIPVEVINAGLPNFTTAQAREVFPKLVLARQPRIVVVQFGINDAAVDVWRKKNPATTPRVARELYEENLRFFIRVLHERGTSVIVMTPNALRWTADLKNRYGKPPYDPADPDSLNVLLRQYAASARQAAGAEKAKLIDIFAAYAEKPAPAQDALLSDGVHPNDKGHRLAADLLLPELVKLLKEKGGM